ncbi:MAG: LPS assembly protein LptD [Holosporales bacterium]|nr:LPS assembly protein LptD [Holosporales bacterium]
MNNVIAAISLALLCVCASDAKVVLNSKVVSFDPDSGVITAAGDVVVTQEMEDHRVRELHTDQIEYNKTTGEIRLKGNALIKDYTGDLFSAKNIELDADFKNAIAEALVFVTKDSIKVKSGTCRKSGDVFTFKDASYSPCREGHCTLPLWDLAAETVVYDRKEKKFIYKNVKLRIKGVPVLFTPYLTHPSPEVKRKTGVLTPIIRHCSKSGLFVGIPFYVAVSNSRDLKIVPFLNSKKRMLMATEYRQKFVNGDLDISASALSRSKSKTAEKADKYMRWHIDSSYCSYNLDGKSLAVRLNRSKDVTYKTAYPADLRRHNKSWFDSTYNDSNVIFEKYDRSYFLTAESHIFQTEDKYTAPSVLPHFNFNCTKGDFTFDGDVMYLARRHAQSPTLAKRFCRATNKIGWNKSTNLNQFLFEVNSGIRTDFYSVGEAQNTAKPPHRIFPIFENQATVSMPMVSRIKLIDNTVIWGPKVSFTSIETSNKRVNFKPNEDSVFNNFSDLNLYAFNRFGGYDSVDLGERISTGIEGSSYNDKRRWLNAFIGKSTAIANRKNSSLRGRNAMVGRVVLKPLENVSVRMRFTGCPLFEKSQTFETGVNASYKNVFGGVGYFRDAKISDIQNNGLSQLNLNYGMKVTEFWTVTCSQVINLKHDNGKHTLAHGVLATYDDECFTFSTGIYKTNFKKNDVKPRVGVALTIVFKTLGSIRTRSPHQGNTELGKVE